MSDRLLVLGWHNVRGSWCFPSTTGAGPRGLARQLAFLDRVATVVPLEDALERLSAGEPLPPRAVALTFDDGYADVLELAVPLLERLDQHATFFLVPRLLSGDIPAWWERAGWAFSRTTRAGLSWEGTQLDVRTGPARRRSYGHVSALLKRRDRAARDAAVEELVALLQPAGDPPGPGQFLTWSGARELVTRGFSVDSHSEYHSILSQEEPAEQERDLRHSRSALQSLGVQVNLLAYPNGTVRDYDAPTLDAARQAGHRFAVTTVDGFNSRATAPLEIRRSVVYPERGVLDLARNLSYAWRAAP